MKYSLKEAIDKFPKIKDDSELGLNTKPVEKFNIPRSGSAPQLKELGADKISKPKEKNQVLPPVIQDEDDTEHYNCWVSCSDNTKYILDKIGFKLTYFISSILLLGIGLIFLFEEQNIILGGILIHRWLFLFALIFGGLFVGGIINFVIFGIIDLIFYFDVFRTIYYYITSFNGVSGMIVSGFLFLFYYTELTGFPDSQIINRLTYCFIILVSSIGLHSLIVKIFMFKRINNLFEKRVKKMLLYVELFKRISNLKKMDENPIEVKINSWAMYNIRHNGLKMRNSKNDFVQILKVDDIKYRISKIWRKLLKYSFENKTYLNPSKIHLNNVMDWMGIKKDDKYFNEIKDLIDLNNDTFVRKEEFQRGFISMYKEWKNFNTSYYDHTSISNVIGISIGIIFSFFLIYIFLAIFEVPSETVFAPLLTVIVSLSFAISNIISKLISSLIFVGYIYPYDIGDRIKVKHPFLSDTLIVKKINILTTIFRELSTGKQVIIPNYELLNCVLENHQRSYEVNFVIQVKISNSIADEIFERIKLDFQEDFINNNIERWKPDLEVYIDNTNLSEGYMNTSWWIRHQFSWMQGYNIWTDYTLASKFLIELLKKHNVHYQIPPQIIKIKNE